MKTEVIPEKWFRFGNVINTTEGLSIYCIELSSFPETHMLTKFKCESFSVFPKTIENLGWKYERVVAISKKSGSVTRVETENHIVFLDEEKRITTPIASDFIDNSPSWEIADQTPWPVIRSEYSDVYQYLNSKRLKPCSKYSRDCYCGKCWWAGISIAPECIPECTMCRNDTQKVSIKVNAGIKKVEIEPDCCKACIWWDWFHTIRKNMVGCKCDDICDCGKLSYRKKETVVLRMEKLQIKHK
jgi:hypothetical protein